jgi:hypothetical protein
MTGRARGPAGTNLVTDASRLYCPGMRAWAEAIGSLADESGFAGVVSVDRGGEIDRAHQIPNTLATRFAIASGTKGLTALTVRYGLGFWLGARDSTVMLEGLDAGVPFWSAHDPGPTVTRTVISNSSDGAWPVALLLDELLAS